MNLPWALATWDWPSGWIWMLTIVIGIVGTLGQWASIRPSAGVDASGIAPVQYLRIVLSAILGAWLFAEKPDTQTVVGATLVTLSALYITVREATMGRASAGRAAASSGRAQPRHGPDSRRDLLDIARPPGAGRWAGPSAGRPSAPRPGSVPRPRSRDPRRPGCRCSGGA